MSMRILLLAVSCVLAACPGPAPNPPPPSPVEQPPVPPPSDPPPAGTNKPAGATCLVATECESGICEGEGCAPEQPGTCAPKARGCTRDLRPYCGCDGQVFRTSGNCPGQRFASRGECKSAP